MSNPLTDIPTGEPRVLVAGDTWSWKRTDLAQDYPPASWALSYTARHEVTGATVSIAATESGDEYVVNVAAATTAAYAAGRYAWDAYATRSSDAARVRIGRGIWIVEPNLATATGELRSEAAQQLALVDAQIKQLLANPVEDYTIAQRSARRRKLTELYQIRDRLRQEVAAEALRRAGVDGSQRRVNRYVGPQ